MTPLAARILDFLLLHAGWSACVLGAAAGRFWLGPAVVALGVTLHLFVSARPRRDAATLLLVALIGVGGDLILVACGVLAFPVDAPRLGVLPIWILVLWPLFGANFHTTLAWLHERPRTAALLGALGGPPGYVAAEHFGAIEFGRPLPLVLLALATAWAVILPVGVRIARRHERVPVPA